MNYSDIINSVGSVATAGALIWAFVQHRLDTKQLKIQMNAEHEKYRQERLDFEKTQINARIDKLDERFDKYTEIFLTTEKLKWALEKLKNEVSTVDNINIDQYEHHFTNIANILDKLVPWQQAIIGDLPVDPLLNKYYSYYNYTKSKELLDWIENFQEQIEETAEHVHKMSTNFSEQSNKLKSMLLQL